MTQIEWLLLKLLDCFASWSVVGCRLGYYFDTVICTLFIVST